MTITTSITTRTCCLIVDFHGRKKETPSFLVDGLRARALQRPRPPDEAVLRPSAYGIRCFLVDFMQFLNGQVFEWSGSGGEGQFRRAKDSRPIQTSCSLTGEGQKLALKPSGLVQLSESDWSCRGALRRRGRLPLPELFVLQMSSNGMPCTRRQRLP
jgi:hypothetical protein